MKAHNNPLIKVEVDFLMKKVIALVVLFLLAGCAPTNQDSKHSETGISLGTAESSFDEHILEKNETLSHENSIWDLNNQSQIVLHNLDDISPGQYLQTMEFIDDKVLVLLMTGAANSDSAGTYITTFDINENSVIEFTESEEINIQFTKDFLYLPFMDELLPFSDLELISDSILVGQKGGIVSESGEWIVPYSSSEEVMTFTNRYTGEMVSVKLNEEYPRVKVTSGFLNDNTVIHTYCDDFANTLGIGITSMDGTGDFYETRDTHIAVANGHALTSMRYFWDAADYPYIRKTNTQNKLVATTIPNEGEFKLTADGKYIRQWKVANNNTTEFAGGFLVNLYDYDTEKLTHSFDIQFEDGYTYAQDSCAVSTDGNKIAFLSEKDGERFLCILTLNS